MNRNKQLHALILLAVCLIGVLALTGCGGKGGIGKNPFQFQIGSDTFELGRLTTDDVRKKYKSAMDYDTAVLVDLDGLITFGGENSDLLECVVAQSTKFKGYKGIQIGQTYEEICNALGEPFDENGLWIFGENGEPFTVDKVMADITNKNSSTICAIGIEFSDEAASTITVSKMALDDLR